MKKVDTVIFGLDKDYTIAAYAGLNQMTDVGIVSHYSNKFTDIYLSKKLAHHFSLPFKQKYFEKCLVQSNLEIDNSKSTTFVFFESKYAYNPEYLKYLRRNFPKCFISLVLLNPFTIRGRYEDWQPIFSFYDLIVTCIPQDAQKFGFTYCRSCYTKNPEMMSAEVNFDITYTGLSGKVRDQHLRDLFKIFNSAGFACDFTIIDPSLKHDYVLNGVYYKKNHLSYKDIVYKTLNSKAVLELVQNNLNYQTLRTMESMVYQRKLITNNLHIENADFYNKNNIFIVGDTFDLDSFNKFMQEKNVPINKEIFSPIKLINTIREKKQLLEVERETK